MVFFSNISSLLISSWPTNLVTMQYGSTVNVMLFVKTISFHGAYRHVCHVLHSTIRLF